MKKIENLLDRLKEAIRNHEPLVVNFGKGNFTDNDIKEIIYWSNAKNTYIGEIGQWSTKLLLEIAKGEVENTTIELMPNE